MGREVSIWGLIGSGNDKEWVVRNEVLGRDRDGRVLKSLTDISDWRWQRRWRFSSIRSVEQPEMDVLSWEFSYRTRFLGGCGAGLDLGLKIC